ncbi:hypothetical protein L0F63_001080, partial [Massospora cicadina]
MPRFEFDTQDHPGKIYQAVDENSAGLKTAPVSAPEVNEDLSSKAQKIVSLGSMISRIGFGKFQKQMLLLCGLGWLADNMWLQCVAVILPRAERLQLDAGGGRVFGLLSSVAPSFSSLCLCLFSLGFGVGGNMPVDGALFLIYPSGVPTLADAPLRFSFRSERCSPPSWRGCPGLMGLVPSQFLGPTSCDVETENNGWRYLLLALGFLNLLMVVARVVLFKLPESPKFLMAQSPRRCSARAASYCENQWVPPIEPIPEVEEQLKAGLESLRWAAISTTILQDNATCLGDLDTYFLCLHHVQRVPPKVPRDEGTWRWGSAGSPRPLEGLYGEFGGRGFAIAAGFANASSTGVITFTSGAFSFLITIVYAVLYAYTPEVFDTKVRGTASGVASALGRIAGIGCTPGDWRPAFRLLISLAISRRLCSSWSGS